MERRDEQSIEAVKLYYQQGLSQAEVATRMGLSRRSTIPPPRALAAGCL